MTVRQAVQLLLRRVSQGRPSDESAITENEVKLWLDHAVAAAAVRAYQGAVQVDGIESVPEGFHHTFKNLVLTEDEDTGYFEFTLPSKPYGLSRGWDITSVKIEGTRMLSQELLRVSPSQLGFYKTLNPPKNAIFFWVEGVTGIVDSPVDLTGKKVRVTMPAQSLSMDDEMNVSEDQLVFITEYILKNFLSTLNVQPDLSNDGKPN
jgi:hypothetical protein